MAIGPSNADDTFMADLSVADSPVPAESPSAQDSRDAWESVQRGLNPLASLRLTVWLFVASIFIVFVGTLAQTRMDIWQVVGEFFRFSPGKLVSGSFPYINLGELFCWIDFAVFTPPAFTSEVVAYPSGRGFYFPKGWTIGLVMLANLTAAHLVRFKLQAKGPRLAIGCGITAFGLLLTYGVIATTGGSMGFQNESAVDYSYVWTGLLFSMLLLGAGGVYGGLMMPKHRLAERLSLIGLGVGFAGAAIWLGLQPDKGQFDDSSMRILWHLIKATIAGLVLLGGCVVLFRKRAGIVLLHAGVLLLMVGEIVVGLCAVEGKMSLFEGRSANYVEDIRDYELALSEVKPDGTVVEQVIDSATLNPGLSSEDAVETAAEPLDAEPFTVTVERFEPAGLVEEVRRDAEGIFSRGAAAILKAGKTAIGVGPSAEQVDYPGAVVTLAAPDFEESFVLSTGLDAPSFEYDGRKYIVDLRFKRTYKPYTLTLREMKQETYIGTDTPQDFSAKIAFVDPEQKVSRPEIRIWMNNPLRYGGDTFYQSGYNGPYRDPETQQLMPASTTLQVVSNVGWSIPYVACMLTAVGMAAQFLISLLRYVDRRRSNRLPEQQMRSAMREDTENPVAKSGGWIPVAIAIGWALLLVGKYASNPPITDRLDRDVTAFATLPVVEGGRVKPMSTLALNTMLQLSDKQSAYVPVVNEDDPEKTDLVKVSAVEWLADLAGERPAGPDVLSVRLSTQAAELLGLDDQTVYPRDVVELALKDSDFDGKKVLSREFETWTPLERELMDLTIPAKAADAVRIFRIEDEDARRVLNLPRRKRFAYAFCEIRPMISALQAERSKIQKIDMEQRTAAQKRIAEVSNKVGQYLRVQSTFSDYSLGRLPSEEEMTADPTLRRRVGMAYLSKLAEMQSSEVLDGLPLVVPNEIPKSTGMRDSYQDWIRYQDALVLNEYFAFRGEQPMDATIAFRKVLRAAGDAETTSLTAAAADFQELLSRVKPRDYSPAKLAFENHYNRFAPSWFAAYLLYLPAFLLVVLSWLTPVRDNDPSVPLGRVGLPSAVFRPRNILLGAVTLIAVAFVVHTYALGARMYISGRPPVTNLYSSSVFIGWAGVLFGLVIELIDRRGLGTLIASVFGFATLLISHVLASSGDTFTVMQAVLDTQFWLATHVVIITLGYSATLAAGVLGAYYIIRGVLTSSLDPATARTVARMCYGVNCFAILFSFVGTVLGGLWADDSWGRFWGWDPKENGALMIVLWNAIVLHAHWGKMVQQRGLAVLSVLGNIVVAWSWFGVNELGVGLHSYGFTDGVLLTLKWFAISQLAIAGMGMLPMNRWASRTGGRIHERKHAAPPQPPASAV